MTVTSAKDPKDTKVYPATIYLHFHNLGNINKAEPVEFLAATTYLSPSSIPFRNVYVKSNNLSPLNQTSTKNLKNPEDFDFEDIKAFDFEENNNFKDFRFLEYKLLEKGNLYSLKVKLELKDTEDNTYVLSTETPMDTPTLAPSVLYSIGYCLPGLLFFTGLILMNYFFFKRKDT